MGGPEHEALEPAHAEPAEAPLAEYSEEDDVATQQIQMPRGDFKWIVQLTPLDRRMMDTAQLVAELLDGTRVHRRTLVWRGGMDDWQPIESIGDLPIGARQAATQPPAARRRARMAPRRAVMISLIVALSTTAMALFALGKRGAFDGDDSTAKGPEAGHPLTVSASETAVRALEPDERTGAVPVAAPVQVSDTSTTLQE